MGRTSYVRAVNTKPSSLPADGPDSDEITLGLLNAVEANSTITQRSVAQELGIALGLANAYLKRCARKGLIKVTQIPANRYAYYLTPKGFAEKSRLTASYLSISFNFFRAARNDLAEEFDRCRTRGWRRVALAGAGDLAEIATLCAADAVIALVGVLDADVTAERFAGLPVATRLGDLARHDAILITHFLRPQETFDELSQAMSAERVLTPKLLSISRERPTLAEDD